MDTVSLARALVAKDLQNSTGSICLYAICSTCTGRDLEIRVLVQWSLCTHYWRNSNVNSVLVLSLSTEKRGNLQILN